MSDQPELLAKLREKSARHSDTSDPTAYADLLVIELENRWTYRRRTENLHRIIGEPRLDRAGCAAGPTGCQRSQHPRRRRARRMAFPFPAACIPKNWMMPTKPTAHEDPVL
jgi:hypothetical protein